MRQLVLFLLFGGLQLAIDTGVLILLLSFDFNSWGANVLSRFTAFFFGFLLNGSITFRSTSGERKIGGRTFVRLVLVWVSLTALSSALLTLLIYCFPDTGVAPIKIGVEALMAVFSFFISRAWVYI